MIVRWKVCDASLWIMFRCGWRMWSSRYSYIFSYYQRILESAQFYMAVEMFVFVSYLYSTRIYCTPHCDGAGNFMEMLVYNIHVIYPTMESLTQTWWVQGGPCLDYRSYGSGRRMGIVPWMGMVSSLYMSICLFCCGHWWSKLLPEIITSNDSGIHHISFFNWLNPYQFDWGEASGIDLLKEFL